MSIPLQERLIRHGVSNVVYIPNSVDRGSIAQVDRSQDENSIIFIGSMTNRKRPMVMLKAFEIVAAKIRGARLVMIGEGPLRRLVEDEIRKKNLNTQIKVFPYVETALLESLRSHSRIFVLPSASEGLSLALVEAMAAGQALIVSRIESHTAVLQHAQSALFFELDNPEDLARQMYTLMTDANLRLQLSESAVSLFEAQFSNTIIARRLEALYTAAMVEGPD